MEPTQEVPRLGEVPVEDYDYRPPVELLGSVGEAILAWFVTEVARASGMPNDDVKQGLQLGMSREPEPWMRIEFSGVEYVEMWDGVSSASARDGLDRLVRILAGHVKENRARAKQADARSGHA